MSNPLETLGKPIGGGVGSGVPVGHTVPTGGFDQGEHGAGTGVSGGHVPSATNQAKGYGQDSSNFNAGLGGEHASGGLPGSTGTPIADKFMGTGSGTGSGSHGSSGGAVSGAYSGGGTRDALTGESDAHRTGAGVGYLAENLKGATSSSGTTGTHSSSLTGSDSTRQSQTVGDNTYGGSIDRHATGGGQHAHSARDAALTGTAGAAAATALGSGTTGGQHGSGSHGSHGIQSGTEVGIGPTGGSGGHYSTEGQHGSGTGTGHSHSGAGLGAGAGAAGLGAGAAAAGLAGSRSSGQTGSGEHYNTGTGTSAGVLAAQQASSRGTHGDSGLSGTGLGAGAGAAGVGAGAAGAAASSGRKSGEVERGQPLSDPKELDHGTRHSLVLDPATGKYVHRHEIDEKK